MFTWIPIYTELATRLLEYRDRQAELLEILKQAQQDGLTTISLRDRGVGNQQVPLKEMDPFTFFANFNRQVADDKRKNLLAVIKEKLGLTSSVPEDFDGIPIKPANKSWFLRGRKTERTVTSRHYGN